MYSTNLRYIYTKWWYFWLLQIYDMIYSIDIWWLFWYLILWCLWYHDYSDAANTNVTSDYTWYSGNANYCEMIFSSLQWSAMYYILNDMEKYNDIDCVWYLIQRSDDDSLYWYYCLIQYWPMLSVHAMIEVHAVINDMIFLNVMILMQWKYYSAMTDNTVMTCVIQCNEILYYYFIDDDKFLTMQYSTTCQCWYWY